jgi:D-proline reductase (dithiol) PrdB
VSRVRVDYIPRTRELYAPLPPYRWADNRHQPVPWAPLRKPLSQCRILLVGSGGIYADGQPPFQLKDDVSIRLIATDTPTSMLRVSHFGYPTVYAEEDPNCVFPLDRLRELADDGVIGELAPSAISCMGGIYSHRRVLADLAPEILAQVERQRADLVYLVPA